MKTVGEVDLEYICTFMGNLAGIPIRLFREGKLEKYHSVVYLPKDPMYLYKDDIFAVDANVGYFITPHFNYYGIVNSGNLKIVVGPTRQIIHNPQELRALAFRMDIPPEETESFIRGMQDIVRMPLDSVMQMLCMVNYILNGERLGLDGISIYDVQQLELRKALASQRMENYLQAEDKAVLAPKQHNTYYIEQTILDIISSGDTEVLKEWISSAPAVRPGVMASDQLRQIKNTFIVTATLVSRAAIRGGMEAEDALALSDAYIQKCELLSDVGRINNLQYNMVMEYTELVEQIRKNTYSSELAIEAANYIRRHMSEPITAESIARHLNFSRPYLSTKFIEETGISLTDFILQEKTEEAKRLLCHSDKSLISISSFLGFSSQSHFSRVFKKYSGYTPSEYRSKYT